MRTKLISLVVILAMLVTTSVYSQGTDARVMLGSNGKAIDTVTDTGSETWTLKVPGPNKAGFSAEITYTKISGTVAGNIVLLGSNSGLGYDTVYVTPIATARTVVATNVATRTFLWKLDKSDYLYYRIQWTGTGTMQSSAKCFIIARNSN